MFENESIAMMMKVEQLGLFAKARCCSLREASELFDRYRIWDFIDDAYYGLHVQGAEATFEDICAYIQNTYGDQAV